MFFIPSAFGDENEDYLTLPVLKSFARLKRSSGFKISEGRPELVRKLEVYANESSHNQEEVLCWLDNVTKEGIKDVYVKMLHITERDLINLTNPEYISNSVTSYMEDVTIKHICGNAYDENFKLVKCTLNNISGNKLSLIFCKMVFIDDKKKPTKKIIYPVFVDIILSEGIIVGRAKPKAAMYEYNKNGYNPATANALNTSSEILKAMECTLDIFPISVKDKTYSLSVFKNKIYRLLDEFTHTPSCIKEQIECHSERINDISREVVAEICKVSDVVLGDVVYDIRNTIEKYISICWPDKSVFTLEREAYPLKIIATDEEDSHIEQASTAEDPLQSKAVFFDNKKMLQKNMKCDGVCFCYERLNGEYMNNKFKVRIIAKKDYCLIKFTEYTREEDIIHVISSVINA
jgi:hypothetical protein|nr:MAG TPA: hypothetical protein [Caudoviricetes sp.]